MTESIKMTNMASSPPQATSGNPSTTKKYNTLNIKDLKVIIGAFVIAAVYKVAAAIETLLAKILPSSPLKSITLKANQMVWSNPKNPKETELITFSSFVGGQ